MENSKTRKMLRIELVFLTVCKLLLSYFRNNMIFIFEYKNSRKYINCDVINLVQEISKIYNLKID